MNSILLCNCMCGEPVHIYRRAGEHIQLVAVIIVLHFNNKIIPSISYLITIIIIVIIIAFTCTSICM